MKVCASNLAWTPDLDQAAAAILRDSGAWGVELALTKYWDEPVEATDLAMDRVADAWFTSGLQIVALQSLLFGRPDLQLFGEDGGLALARYLVQLFGVAQKLGATRLVFGSPRNRQRGELAMDVAYARAHAVFEKLGVEAESHGLRLCIEPNPPNYGCDFLTTAAEAAEFVAKVDSPGIGVQLDTACALLANEPFEDAVHAADGWLAHVHASEPGLAHLGVTGEIDHHVAGRALRAAGYEGWVSVEVLARPETGKVEVLEALTRTVVTAVEAYG